MDILRDPFQTLRPKALAAFGHFRTLRGLHKRGALPGAFAVDAVLTAEALAQAEATQATAIRR
eukprot:5157142-Alexandrium_andersonii.AAC.1